MRKIREALYLYFENGLSARKIARTLSVSHTTVDELMRRFQASGLSWPLPGDLSDSDLEQRLYPPAEPSKVARAALDVQWIHAELRKKGVTLALLWEEYVRKHQSEPHYAYSQFCHLYREWRKSLDVVMRHTHKAGEKVFIDFVGPTVSVEDQESGETVQAQIFVAVLGASNYMYVRACPSQQVRPFIEAVGAALAYFDGVPEALVPDNLKSAVTKPSRYEAELNAGFGQLAEHYHVAVIPARPLRPRDKAAVEKAVQDVERQILAPLRNRVFFSFIELNEALWERLEMLNHKPFQKMDGSRWSLFNEVDKPALRPLPSSRFEWAEWKRAKVASDYHIQVQFNFYSVPYQLVHLRVDVRVTDHLVEVFYKNERVASHQRRMGRGRYSTLADHLAPKHKAVTAWTPENFLASARRIGPHTEAFIQAVLESKQYKEQAYRTCRGVLSLAQKYEAQRMEAATQRALSFRALTWRSLKSILEKGLDRVPSQPPSNVVPLRHENIRGAAYFTD